jgi:beta-lactamase superfamily II metal-dependent hydrolase
VGFIAKWTMLCHTLLSAVLISAIPTMNSAEDMPGGKIPDPTTYVQVYALPVGQGDCTVIQCPNGNIVVVDCGSSGGTRHTPSSIENYLGNHIDKVVAIIVTHSDKDHYNKIRWNYDSIRDVIIGGYLKDYECKSPHNDFHFWLLQLYFSKNKLRWINDGQPCIKGVKDCVVTTGTDIFDTNFRICNDEEIKFDILAANVQPSEKPKPNEKSIVLKLTDTRENIYGQYWSMLLPGDIEGEAACVIASELKLGGHLQSYVYKMAHHGACSKANRPIWLQPIQPKQAFASSGFYFGNCHHPRCTTINRIKGLHTIKMEQNPHHLYCGTKDQTEYEHTYYHIYETSPAENVECVLKYTSQGHFDQACDHYNLDYKLAQLPYEDDDCNDGCSLEECPVELGRK